jgi:hypothetical protein
MLALMRSSFLMGMMFIMSTSISFACSFPPAPLEDKVERADEIFIATLDAAKVIPDDYTKQQSRIEGSFRVSKTLKGPTQAAETKLVTGLGGGDCGVLMIVSAKYIIFKQRGATAIWTPSGTRMIEHFEEYNVEEKIRLIVQKRKSQRK